MMSPWLTATHTAPGAVLGLVERVEPTYGGDRAGLHGGHRLAVGERRRRRLGLHGPPERLLGQVLEGAALPGPVVTLGDAALGRRGRGTRLRLEDGSRGLPAPLERAGDHRDQGDRREPLRGPLGLVDAGVVEPDAGRPAGEHSGGVGRGATVSYQDHRCHAGDPTAGYLRACDRRQRPLPQGAARRGRLLPPRVRQAAGRGHRGRRLRLGRALQAQRGRAQRGGRARSGCTRSPSRTRSRRTSGPSSSATTTACSSPSRRSGTSTPTMPSRPVRSTCSPVTTS